MDRINCVVIYLNTLSVIVHSKLHLIKHNKSSIENFVKNIHKSYSSFVYILLTYQTLTPKGISIISSRISHTFLIKKEQLCT